MKYLAAFLLMLFGFATHAQQATYGGVYVICDIAAGGTADSQCKSALQTPLNGVLPGLFLTISWSGMQDATTCASTYPCTTGAWTSTSLGSSQSIDTFLLNAKANNQNIAIGIKAGKFTPLGARGATIECDPTYGPSSTNFFPVPWDSTYITNYKAAIHALSTHLTSIGVMPWVKIVKASGGINTATTELYSDGGINVCTDSGLIFNQVWANAGFTPSVIQTAVNSLLAEYIADFPAPIIKSYEVIFVGAFPWVNQNGRLFQPAANAKDLLTSQLLSSIYTNNCSEKFAVQYNAEENQPINTPQSAISVIQSNAGCHNVVMGGQLNVRGGITTGGTYCNYGGTAQGTWVGTTNTISITNLHGYVFSGAVTDGATNFQAGGVVSTFTPTGPGAGTIVFTGNTTVGSATNVPITLELLAQCGANAANASITGTADGDFELLFDSATSVDQKWIEVHAVNNVIDGSGSSQVQRVAAALAAKRMSLPHD